MPEEQQYRIRLHLNTGKELDIHSYNEAGLDLNAIATEFAEDLNGSRPRWIEIENVTFFSGAVTAIEVEAL